MFFPEQLFILLASVTEVGNDSQAQLFDLNRIFLSLKKLKEVVNDSFLTDFDFVGFFEKGGIGEGFETFFSSFHVSSIGQKLRQAEDSFLFLKIILHVENCV